FIVGNPPFGGGKDIRAEQGDAYAAALWRLNPKMNDSADLVMYWWDRAADILTRRDTKLKRFGLVTTNSIAQVFQRRTVARWLSAANPNKQPLSLVFAVDDHPWTKATRDAAAVRIAMTVAAAGTREGELATVTREARLGTDQPEVDLSIAKGMINADLTVGVDLNRAASLQANQGLCSRGMSLHGAGFIVGAAEAEHLGLGRRPGLEAHIRPYRNGRDLMGRSREKLVIDLFGLTAQDVRDRFPEVYQHLVQTVKAERQKVFDKSGTRDAGEYLEKWWLFGRPRQEIRPALAGLPRYIATVETAKHRVFQFLDGSILPDNKLLVVASSDAAHLAVLSSVVHHDWYLGSAGKLGVYERDAVYVKSRCFDPFPFPAWTEGRRAALAAAGERLDAFRKARLAENPGLTLTRLYNALEAHRAGRPMSAEEAADFDRGSVTILAELHGEIDAASLAAYGWPADLTGEALLAAVVALNGERAAEEARGEVRWLRPAYQRARFARATVAGPEQAGDLIGAIPAPPAARANWPAKRRDQVLALKGALAEAPGPLTPAALAARFKGRRAAPDIARLIAVLERDGQVRRGSDGGASLLRAG
ncbi:MAG: DNA methyltransferase, partial [Caulobacteraceae bacterium]